MSKPAAEWLRELEDRVTALEKKSGDVVAAAAAASDPHAGVSSKTPLAPAAE